MCIAPLLRSANPEITEDDLTCPINYTPMQKVATLVCGHSFDESAITRWFRTKKICPLCRTTTSILPDDATIAKMVRTQARREQLQQACNAHNREYPPEAIAEVDQPHVRSTDEIFLDHPPIDTPHIVLDHVDPDLRLATSVVYGPEEHRNYYTLTFRRRIFGVSFGTVGMWRHYVPINPDPSQPTIISINHSRPIPRITKAVLITAQIVFTLATAYLIDYARRAFS